jgi:hypothetical protein
MAWKKRRIMAAASDTRWVARLHPPAGGTVDALLRLPYALDVWQREATSLVVAASETTLSEIERRRLARVDRISPTADFVRRAEGDRD